MIKYKIEEKKSRSWDEGSDNWITKSKFNIYSSDTTGTITNRIIACIVIGLVALLLSFTMGVISVIVGVCILIVYFIFDSWIDSQYIKIYHPEFTSIKIAKRYIRGLKGEDEPEEFLDGGLKK